MRRGYRVIVGLAFSTLVACSAGDAELGRLGGEAAEGRNLGAPSADEIANDIVPEELIGGIDAESVGGAATAVRIELAIDETVTDSDLSEAIDAVCFALENWESQDALSLLDFGISTTPLSLPGRLRDLDDDEVAEFSRSAQAFGCPETSAAIFERTEG